MLNEKISKEGSGNETYEKAYDHQNKITTELEHVSNAYDVTKLEQTNLGSLDGAKVIKTKEPSVWTACATARKCSAPSLDGQFFPTSELFLRQ